MRPKAILFDLDGTLFNRDAAVRELVSAQHAHFAEAFANLPRETYVQRLMELDGHGHVERPVVYSHAVREFGLPADMGAVLVAHFWESFPPFCRSFPEVPEVLAALRAEGIKLGIITNGSIRGQEMKIRQLHLGPLIDEIVIAEREGIGKPDPRIFERALHRLGVSAKQAWFVGDHPDADIRGAYEAGLTAVWRYAPHWHRPEAPAHEIRDLLELIPLLDSLTLLD